MERRLVKCVIDEEIDSEFGSVICKSRVSHKILISCGSWIKENVAPW